MRFFCISIRSKKMLAMLFGLIIFLLMFLQYINVSADKNVTAVTNEDRIQFLITLGYNVEDQTPNTKQSVIPQKFNDVFSLYNELQLKADFDLSLYKGCEVTVYSYPLKTVNNKEQYFANLIVADSKIIGGDISSVNINGEMFPLANRSINNFDAS